MGIPSLIFFGVFVIPLVIFLVWVMRQDKRKGVSGLIVLAALIVMVLLYMHWQKLL